MRLELTRRSDYAVRAALVLAAEPGQTLSSTEIAQRTQIPVRFVTQVMAYLVRAELVRATIGRAGGYALACSPTRVTVLQIVEAAEGDTRRSRCVLRPGPCARRAPCEVHRVFAGAQAAFTEALASETLATIAAAEPIGLSRRSSGASRCTRPPARDAAG